MTQDLVKFIIPADFIIARVELYPGELAYGYAHGWLDEAAVVDLAANSLGKSSSTPRLVQELGILLRDDLDKVPGLISEIKTSEERDPGEVWLYLALDWINDHQDQFDDPFETIEMLSADFGFPTEIEDLVRFMPPKKGAEIGLPAIQKRWNEFLLRQSEWYATRPYLCT